jgi:hypothetical protein
MTNSMTFPRVRITNGQAAALYYAGKRRLSAFQGPAIDDKASHAYGTIRFSANPSSGATITLGGTVVHFGTDVAISASLAVTLANLLTFLQASVDANIAKCTYYISGSDLSVRSKEANDASFTLAASVATVSGATLKLMKINSRVAL